MLRYYLPQLDYAFSKYWETFGELETDNIPLPSVVREDFDKNSVFDLLFNNSYMYDDYVYNFSSSVSIGITGRIRERLNFGYHRSIPFITSDDVSSSNILNFTDENLRMFDLLLEYRKENEPDLDDIVYEDLTSNLSKLIYIYLQFFVNANYDYISETSISSNDNILEKLYEIYVSNEIHRYIRITNISISDQHVNITPHRLKVVVDTDVFQQQKFILDETIYGENFYLYKNGLIQNEEIYDIVEDTSGNLTVEWTETMDVKENDVLLADYYVEVVE